MYLSDQDSLMEAQKLTGLALDEIESVVGRFGKQSKWSGQLRGKLVVRDDGTVQIRASFGNKLLWEKNKDD